MPDTPEPTNLATRMKARNDARRGSDADPSPRLIALERAVQTAASDRDVDVLDLAKRFLAFLEGEEEVK